MSKHPLLPIILVSNILATAYSVYLLVVFGGAIIEAGGADFVEAIGVYFKVAFDLFGTSSSTINFMYAIVALLCVHIITFVLGCLAGWIAFAAKKSGGAKFAAETDSHKILDLHAQMVTIGEGEIQNAQETIPQAIIQRAQHSAYGYFDPRKEYFDAIIRRLDQYVFNA